MHEELIARARRLARNLPPKTIDGSYGETRKFESDEAKALLEAATELEKVDRRINALIAVEKATYEFVRHGHLPSCTSMHFGHVVCSCGHKSLVEALKALEGV